MPSPRSSTVCLRGCTPTRSSGASGPVPRSADTNRRERQLAVDFIAAAAGGPTFYLGRDMKTAHAGMGITGSDYQTFVRHTVATLDSFKVPEREKSEVLGFLSTLEREIVEK
jgi:hemoglobin